MSQTQMYDFPLQKWKLGNPDSGLLISKERKSLRIITI